jgi:hypothetical protein
MNGAARLCWLVISCPSLYACLEQMFLRGSPPQFVGRHVQAEYIPGAEIA